MARVERVQLPKHYQGKEEGTFPRIIRRYSNPHNPTFKSDQLSSAIWEKDYIPLHQRTTNSTSTMDRIEKVPQTQANHMESLQMATKQFQMKKSGVMLKSPQELAKLTNNFSGRRTPRLQLKDLKELGDKQQNKRMVKARSIGRYNDASVFEWQSKPYNIISNFPKQVQTLRLSKLGNPEERFNQRVFF